MTATLKPKTQDKPGTPLRDVDPGVVKGLVDALTAKPEASEASDPWADAVAAPLAPVFTRARVDIEKEIPPSLRALFEVSFSDYFLSLQDGALPENSAKFRQFDAKTAERADEFVKMAKMWAKNRRVAGDPNDGQVSMRAFRTKKDDKLTTVVKFAAMPLVKSEPRQPRTGADPAMIREWAKSEGLTVTERGRIPADIVAKYDAAHATPAPAVIEQPAIDVPPSL